MPSSTVIPQAVPHNCWRLTGVNGMVSGRWQRAALRALLALLPIALSATCEAQQVAAVGVDAEAVAAVSKPSKNRTRFIIGLERAVDFQVFALSNPNRVFVDLPDVKLQLPALPGEAPVGLVKYFRGGLSAPGKARVVIDVTGPVVIERSTIEKDGKATRLVLEMASAEAGATDAQDGRSPEPISAPFGLGAAGLQPPVPKPALSPRARAQAMYRPVIVIDPGHGGDDTGATRHGTVEKDVVLAFSLKLRDKLQSTGRYKVLLTRETDTFVELNARREFAERHLASLFVAVHADYARSNARGATIYSLRDSVASSLQRSARGEVSAHVLSDQEIVALKNSDSDVSAVKAILSDLARREVDTTRDRTSVFVKSVIEFMGETTGLKDNPDRSAAFVVLKSAKVPSILIELGYVTNEADAQLLKSERWREKVSSSIVTAIENYFSHQLARLPM
jgi:N-acetylmuramoyl-L-alanine amidase